MILHYEITEEAGVRSCMLSALIGMYQLTQFVLGSTIITAKLGVKQGSPTSCFLFILFVDEFMNLMKERLNPDGFLDWLHLLMLMDDTVIMATSREQLLLKLGILVEWCNGSGMVINEDKTKFIAFCSPKVEKRPIKLQLNYGTVYVTHCKEYTYLGSIFTSDGKVLSSLRRHVLVKENSMNKLIIFLERNKNAPYEVKKTVVDACFNSSLLYGCEAWLGVKPNRELKTMYMKAIKMLLGVRHSTPNDTCLTESGYPSLEALIQSRQKRFLEGKIAERSELINDPLIFALDLTNLDNHVMAQYINTLLSENANIINEDLRRRRERIEVSESSKMVTYRQFNPGLIVHPIYYERLMA